MRGIDFSMGENNYFLKPLIIGHRGFPAKFPENTIAGFLSALLYGASGVEVDVRLSGDGVPVVIHDEDLKRVAKVELKVREATIKQLRTIHLGQAQTVPTLEEVCRAIPKQYLLFIDIKDKDAVEETYGVLKRESWLDNVIFFSRINILEKIRAIDQKVKLGASIDNINDFEEALHKHSNLNIHVMSIHVSTPLIIGWKAFKELYMKAYDQGIKIAFWEAHTEVGGIFDYSLLKSLKKYAAYMIVDDVIRALSSITTESLPEE